jgi:hypothetical protein
MGAISLLGGVFLLNNHLYCTTSVKKLRQSILSADAFLNGGVLRDHGSYRGKTTIK